MPVCRYSTWHFETSSGAMQLDLNHQIIDTWRAVDMVWQPLTHLAWGYSVALGSSNIHCLALHGMACKRTLGGMSSDDSSSSSHRVMVPGAAQAVMYQRYSPMYQSYGACALNLVCTPSQPCGVQPISLRRPSAYGVVCAYSMASYAICRGGSRLR